MHFIDSHCHLDRIDLSPYDGELDKAIQAAKEARVSHMLCVCIDLEHFSDVLRIARRYPEITASVGVHPTSTEVEEPTVDKLVALADDPKVVAIGETGLDYYRESDDISIQQERFSVHIRAARQTQKPLIVHTRMARKDTIDILKGEGAEATGGVMHCFTENWDMAKQALDLGFYISFSGIVTFNNAGDLREVAKKVPMDRMLIETDSPYLAPVPYRGKSNVPAYVPYVAKCIATVRGETMQVIAEQTTKNFYQLFNQVPKRSL